MAYIYRNNAGRFRLEPGVHTFLPPTTSAPGRNASAGIPSTSSSSSSSSWRPARWFFSGPATVDSRDILLKSSTLQESCPSINLLSGSGAQSTVATHSALRKPHSSSAPNEGITGVEPAFSPPTHMLRMLRKKDASKRSPSLAGDGPVHLENPERETRWYFKYFLGKAHQIYCGNISEKDPLLLAIVKSEFEAEGLRQYRAILWTKFGSQKLCISNSFTSSVSPKKILCLFDIYRLEKGLKEILHYEVQKEVLTLEEQEGSVNFKFGVLYCKEGQTSDEEMYNNENGSPQYQAFLRLLGDRIALKNWDRFKGGLDAKSETTGTESIYTIYEGHEIMFHVSTLLPISTDNRQQIERKRHIGNDIVNIIFFDSSDAEKPLSWKPSMMKTHFTHIFAVITYNKLTNAYRLSIFSEESVPYFGPTIPTSREFTDHEELRHFLLVKLINGEKAAFHSPVFAQKRMRTSEMLLNNILEKYGFENNANGPYRRAFSEMVQDSAEGSPSAKDPKRNDAFIRFGQMLKLNTIIRGDAPTSCITTGISKQIPWQPRRLHMKVHGEIASGDTWGKVLLACVDGGVYALEEHQQPLLLISKSVDVKQIKVAESFGVMILRYDKGRESRISVLQLSDLPLAEVIDRALVKKHMLDRSKGCHIFSTSASATRPLRLVFAVGKRLFIYQWQVEITGRSLSSWNQFTYSELSARFVFVREVPTSEAVQVLSVLDSNMGGRICAGYRNQFDLLDERTGETLHLYRTENIKSQAVAVVEMRSDDDLELLLCFNRNCYLQRITKRSLPSHNQSDIFNTCPSLEELEHQFTEGFTSPGSTIKSFVTSSSVQTAATTDYNFSWNFEPKHIVLAPPYILAFTESAIEFRLLINGSLVHTMTVPKCLLLSSKYDIYFASSSEALHQSVLSGGLCQSPHLLSPQTLETPPVHPRQPPPSQRNESPSRSKKSNSTTNNEGTVNYSGENNAVFEKTQQSGTLEITDHASLTCLTMGSPFASCSSDSSGNQHHFNRYIYCISLRTLTGRHDGSPDRGSCESPNPVKVLEKIRDFRDTPETLQFFPLSPS
ncbi:GTPase-activating Rap/Ran-GAP domain-like protein 3 [Taenia crassiceps]|uniref:GTPase-activating Rap/Ran-GAP domain-like protein 3 n=1 Tax=Taenia crassiceps TaxID=6207 RepID=A0ABR4QTZ3_9CEST